MLIIDIKHCKENKYIIAYRNINMTNSVAYYYWEHKKDRQFIIIMNMNQMILHFYKT